MKFEVSGNGNVKFVAHYLCEKWIDLCQTKSEMIFNLFYTVHVSPDTRAYSSDILVMKKDVVLVFI